VSAVVFAYHDVGCMALRVLRRLGVDIRAVYTHADDPEENKWFGSVTRTCQELGLDVRVGVDPNSPEEIEKIRALKPSVFFSVYYRDLLKSPLLALPAHGGVNLHGSLLPRYRGRAPVNWQILNGETQGGVTLHYMVSKPDAGDIVDQEAFEIGPDDTGVDVYKRMLPAAERVLERSAIAVMEGIAPRTRQVPSKVSTFGRRRPADGMIDWRWSAEDVRNLIRAVTKPYPGAFTFAGDTRVLVWGARHEVLPASADPRARFTALDREPGRIYRERDGLYVACGDRRRLKLTCIEIDGAESDGTTPIAALHNCPAFSSQPIEGL
jgi:UDP-4-amino-4-deoxy-L-arabinose formyltransferase / UDP-glucuronic acid dehydrogenase (UDP-4-keto-hexauronic acid decarboxylating)